MAGSKAAGVGGDLRRQRPAGHSGSITPDMANPKATFSDGTISRWLEEAHRAFDLADGPRNPRGLEHGGWLAMLLLRQLQENGGRADAA